MLRNIRITPVAGQVLPDVVHYSWCKLLLARTSHPGKKIKLSKVYSPLLHLTG
jgi:hypothetical protein